ncbi:lytic transglycosylase domain-containing protein [Comamonas sp.]|uniref:lytic transglycosylase domain-containing protein n=1 Tax=Comamonas sp. TaxID=34028 RepID=UPI00289AF9C0|nr:lytic transglycosylase domain-containing protein [Comamonas sp.]
MSKPGNWVTSVRTIAADITEGFLEITHNSFALIGLIVAFAAVALFAHPDLRTQGEVQLRTWLQDRYVADVGFTPEPEAIERATASNPKELPKDQSAVAYWISKKYKVAAEPIAAIVAEAYEQGAQQKIDPTLILAVMAIESRFNPFAQSTVGAQGLMQVMTRVHTEKYDNFGGNHAAFDPISNLRVGAAILKEYIQITGSVEGALKYYVGAANLQTDGGYAAKVLAEHRRLRQVAGSSTPTTQIKPTLVAKRMVTPMKDEAETESVAASHVQDSEHVALSSNL